MHISDIFAQYVQHLFAGKRCEARELLMAAQDRGIQAEKLIKGVIWPAMDQVDKLYREDHISSIVEHMATRINRQLADQLQTLLNRKPKTGRRMIVTCGDGEIEELGAQMTADLFEAEGWTVWFLGSGVPNDEILQMIGKVRPDVLTIYGSQPCGVPNIRRLIEMIRHIGTCDDMQILLTGGIFNRAHGLAEELKADLVAANIHEALQLVDEHPVRVPKLDVPEPGRRRKRKKKMEMASARSLKVEQEQEVEV